MYIDPGIRTRFQGPGFLLKPAPSRYRLARVVGHQQRTGWDPGPPCWRSLWLTPRRPVSPTDLGLLYIRIGRAHQDASFSRCLKQLRVICLHVISLHSCHLWYHGRCK